MSCPEGAIQLFCDCLIDLINSINAGDTENLITTQYSDLDRWRAFRGEQLICNKISKSLLFLVDMNE